MLFPPARGQGARRTGTRRGAARLLLGVATVLGLSGSNTFVSPPAVRGPLAARGAHLGARFGIVARARGGEGAEAFGVEDAVEALFEEDGGWYTAKVQKDNGDGTYELRWDDPDGGPETSVVKAADMKKFVPRTSLDELEIGSKVKGIVRNIREFGAFVDINSERDGLVHITKMPQPTVKTGPFESGDIVEAVFPDDGEMYPGVVEKVSEDGAIQVKWDDPDGGPESTPCKADEVKHLAKSVVETDQEVEVWIEMVTDEGKLQLSMLPPPDVAPFMGLHPQEWLTGKVETIAPFGLFVSVQPPGGGRAEKGLVHVSKIRDGFVDDINAEAEVGQEVKVRVLDVDTERQKISLSMVDDGGF
mmetsp:Transcript_69311/g.157254  ORF Transcript_69311/g.157254 Transcript_69311/m.157254 type:complete len:360 (-) Transcript_69311:125-1204(-)|eukprot:CAMPEP_0197894856 /NCGR_PEP_ID=MMETSP1439-20131203/36046_1 /TAXON_ID=66791 /ORGANISM="Gonyaulax spinifera, Strain CCMP409" /LENGTH=359 /DNA_ID=CAMNT_0043515243 /DNA_START=47 /DNA_END=1126 /DNA_ORIENTATION=-